MRRLVRAVVQRWLAACARSYLRTTRSVVIAVVGAEGRGTMRYILEQTLSAVHTVRSSKKGYTFDIGIPLSILGLEAGFSSPLKWAQLLVRAWRQSRDTVNAPEIILLECALVDAGDATVVADISRPTYCVISDAPQNTIQAQEYEYVANSAQEFSYVPESFVLRNSKKTIRYGTGQLAELRLNTVTEQSSGATISWQIEGKSYTSSTNTFGVHAQNATCIAQDIAQRISAHVV